MHMYMCVGTGHEHFSAVPDSFYKVFLWNLTEYKKVFYFDADTLAVKNATAAYLDKYEPFAALMDPRSRRPWLQAGMMVLAPNASVFDALHSMWATGEYTYPAALRRGDVSLGDDDQALLQDFFFNPRRGMKERLSLQLHPFRRVDNDKAGYYHSDPADVAMFHKWPAWEASRIEALWKAVRSGRSCRRNPDLMGWTYPS